MDRELSVMLGKILGEIYRTQRASDVPCGAGDAQIYALLNGFENGVKEEVERIGFVPEESLRAMMDVLEPIWLDEAKRSDFKGYYDIEHQLESRGVDRGTAIKILRYLYANHQYVDLINKMDSSGSPIECRRFELDQWD